MASYCNDVVSTFVQAYPFGRPAPRPVQRSGLIGQRHFLFPPARACDPFPTAARMRAPQAPPSCRTQATAAGASIAGSARRGLLHRLSLMFHLFLTYVASVSYGCCKTRLACCICCMRLSPMFHLFSDVCCKCVYLDVAYV